MNRAIIYGLAGLGFLCAGAALAGEAAHSNSTCIVRPGYWGYAPITCDEQQAAAQPRNQAHYERRDARTRH
ncbi:hypothetical protein K9U39_14160 [Rhodoblastus acidophilus]|uniref:Uncharacterized protein n=1 Tax=Candidatus Rhodoblastus alkanivorans TaxID=2954117 RepID=A0ABS9ZBP3_9HYPH|nr:hypothetical protein [Candidatus Rhodoblastus alkanivorans]MCI4677752.1 hypothetical protein [Candidatus Rhodoblastus alkanivorans]MCI4684750.1 hypothetical protein [Candidatus Rhodoblastus alkanivorans]MDI4642073.1 hypothetical protein [Rhodoblastus acidophilus]